MILFIVVPMLIVLWYSLTDTGSDGSVVFTTRHILRFFQPSFEGQPFFQRMHIAVLMRSIWLAIISTALCFVIGYPLAYILSRYFRHKPFLLFLFIAPMWMNFLLRTYAWLTILERNGILNTLLSLVGLPTIEILFTDAAVLLVMVYNFLPFMVLPIYTALCDMDNSYVEAAQDLGANKFQVFGRVIFPLSMPGVISGITMVFMPGVSTFIIPNLLGGREFVLIGNLIEQQFTVVGNRHFGSAIAVVMIVIVLLIMGLVKLLDRKTSDDERVSMNRGGVF